MIRQNNVLSLILDLVSKYSYQTTRVSSSNGTATGSFEGGGMLTQVFRRGRRVGGGRDRLLTSTANAPYREILTELAVLFLWWW